VQGAAGTPVPPHARPGDVPSGAVSRPAPASERPWIQKKL
jgi:hypothetical protein